MTDGDALYRAILEQPDDDAPRLVWADWLDEHGDPDRAEFVRLQCEWAALDPGDPRANELLERWKAILDVRAHQWLQELGPDVPGCGFWRGLPDWFDMATDDLIERLSRLRERVPAQCLSVRLAGFRRDLAHWPGLDSVRCLTLYERDVDPYYPHSSLRGWVWLVQSPRLRRLRRFMATFDVSSGGVLAALAGTDWPELRELELRVAGVDPGRPHPSWTELADAPWFRGLKGLYLRGAGLDDDGALRVLARGRALALTKLNLEHNNLTPAGVLRLLGRPELRRLRAFRLGSRSRAPRLLNGVAVYE